MSTELGTGTDVSYAIKVVVAKNYKVDKNERNLYKILRNDYVQIFAGPNWVKVIDKYKYLYKFTQIV